MQLSGMVTLSCLELVQHGPRLAREIKTLIIAFDTGVWFIVKLTASHLCSYHID